MNKIKLITDSTCDLTQELIEKIDAYVIPLPLHFDEDYFMDGVDITTEKLYEEVEKRNVLPQTVGVNPKQFEETFKKWTSEGYDVIYTGIGSKLSSTFSSAIIAKNHLKLDNVYLVDSNNLSASAGLLLLKMDKLRSEGKTVEEIVDIAQNKIVPNIRCSFAIKTMDYLHKGGRCTGLQKYLISALRIKPIIKVIDGKLSVGKKPIGNINKAIRVIADEAIELKDQIDPDFLTITHSMSHDAAVYIEPYLREKLNVKNIYETFAGCIISSHCGPGCIGILYILKYE